MIGFFFFFNDTATAEIYTLSLHDALPISLPTSSGCSARSGWRPPSRRWRPGRSRRRGGSARGPSARTPTWPGWGGGGGGGGHTRNSLPPPNQTSPSFFEKKKKKRSHTHQS